MKGASKEFREVDRSSAVTVGGTCLPKVDNGGCNKEQATAWDCRADSLQDSSRQL